MKRGHQSGLFQVSFRTPLSSVGETSNFCFEAFGKLYETCNVDCHDLLEPFQCLQGEYFDRKPHWTRVETHACADPKSILNPNLSLQL